MSHESSYVRITCILKNVLATDSGNEPLFRNEFIYF